MPNAPSVPLALEASNVQEDMEASSNAPQQDALSVPLPPSPRLRLHTLPPPPHEAVSLIARRVNDQLPIARLPRELFCQVFTLYIPLLAAVAATRVSRVWRDALLSMPTVWSNLSNYSVFTPPGVLTTLFARSVASALHLDLESTDANCIEVAQCIHDNMQRCVSLSVTFNSKDGVYMLSQALCTKPAPVLRTFKMYDSNSRFNKYSEHGPLFSGNAPMLELVKMNTNFGNVVPSPALQNVKRLLCCTTREEGMSLVRFNHILELFCNVEALAVDLDDWEKGNAVAQLPPSLTDLIVKASKPEMSPYFLLRHIPLNSLLGVRARIHRAPNHAARAEVSARVGETAGADGEDGAGDPDAVLVRQLFAEQPICELVLESLLLNSDFEAAKLEDAPLRVNAFVFHDADGPTERVRRLYGVPLRALHLASAFNTLKLLTASEGVFRALPRGVRAPALTQITLHLFYGPVQRRCGEQGIFMLPSPSSGGEAALDCPVLQTLELSAAPGTDNASGGCTTNLAPHLVREFIATHLAFSAPRLPRLVLEGARLVESPSEEVAALLAIVDDFVWRPGYLCQPTPYDAIMHWD